MFINKALIASNNQHKLQELSKTLEPLKIKLISQASLSIESVEETGLSFVENALIKARYASEKTNLPTIADDSGLVVPALGGAPGIYSSRYSGSDATDQSNIDHLLEKMHQITDRKAYFYCALVYIRNALDPAPLIAVGEFHGTLLETQSDCGGFGYDPIFFIDAYEKTAAQLPTGLKNTISHRAIASQRLLSLMQKKAI